MERNELSPDMNQSRTGPMDLTGRPPQVIKDLGENPQKSPVSPASPQQNGFSPDDTPTTSMLFLSLGSPQLLAELQQRVTRHVPVEESAPRPSTPTSPISMVTVSLGNGASPPQPLSPVSGGSLSLSSPELLRELKQSQPLRHVKPQRGLTTVFSGRGRMTQSQVHASSPVANPTLTPPPMAGQKGEAAKY
ncbi:uncharacterized protein LOC125750431 isoform X2 [Brienomyrus brachyistius]|nr:uncharacterized protein LOC125750431 isoform X2 [Brienomyrus brachyistius]XP_048884203.1 uncharacterized protein LOC125750431 isoform X2 [Brienomyrus brachyistius]